MASSGRTISQEAFESLVSENMEELGMESDEALEDAIQTLTLQGVDLSGIVKCVPGVNGGEHPVITSLYRLKSLAGDLAASSKLEEGVDLKETVEVLDRICELCSAGGSENAAIATRNGGVELLCSVCGALDGEFEEPLVSALGALSSILHDIQSTEAFHTCFGPKIIVDVLGRSKQNRELLDNCFSVVAAAATGNEIVKEKFMELKIDELLLEILKEQHKGTVQSLYDAIRVLLTPDDNRVLASQVYGYARRFANIGIAETLVSALHEGISLSTLVPGCLALKAVAVNDDICRSISEKGGLDAILQCIDASSEHNNKSMAKACCLLLSKLAGSDVNKTAIVQKDGLDKLMRLSSKFADDPSVLQEVMSVITVISLRSPENAALAVEAGAGDMAFQAMQNFPAAYQMQRQSCHMIRNLVARNPENRTILLSNGFEKIIRKAKSGHESCKDAATDALRDLGVDNYST